MRGGEDRKTAGAVDACPRPVPGRTIQQTDRLYVEHRKRLAHAYVTNAEGVKELRIDYGIKEVSFDEEHLFAFGEGIVRGPSFTGQDATTWGSGYEWDEIGPLLESLVEQGVLQVGERADSKASIGPVRPLLPPSVCPTPRSWSLADCEAITSELADRAVEVGYLETFVPVFRVAHPALDADARQVGEGNVFPSKLRLDRETEWRTCQYAGSRYRDDAPMNVTALKAMIKYWKPIMATLLQVRAAVKQRLGTSPERWTIGELHTLSSVVLALLGYQLLKGGGSSPQRPLHPVLSSMFRITDGIRMTTSAMLFSIEHTRRADEPLTGAQLHAHVEQNAVFIGETGVCAGPPSMVDEFLSTVIDGAAPERIYDKELPAEVQELLSQLPAALDYGFYGLQTWGVSLSVWLAMSRAHQAVLAILDGAAPAAGATGEDRWAPLRERLRSTLHVLEKLQITLEYDQDVHLKFYQCAYEQSRHASRSKVGPPTLAEAITPWPAGAMHLAAAKQLREILDSRFAPGELGEDALARIVGVLVQYLREEQAVLASTTQIQGAINALLDRPSPKRPLGIRDFLVFYSLASGVGRFPYLFDTLENELGLHVECNVSAIDVSDRQGPVVEPSPTHPAGISAGG